jgi:hypothetical protein
MQGMKTLLVTAAAVSVLTASLAGCTDAVVPSDGSGEESDDGTEPGGKHEEDSMFSENELQRRLEVRQGVNKVLPERVPQQMPAHMAGEVPESILQAIKEDLSEHINIAVKDLQVVKAEALTWSDGSLGCPKPGETYTQAQVQGYRVILEHAGKQYDYRASERGYFFLCEMPTLWHPPRDSQ